MSSRCRCSGAANGLRVGRSQTQRLPRSVSMRCHVMVLHTPVKNSNLSAEGVMCTHQHCEASPHVQAMSKGTIV